MTIYRVDDIKALLFKKELYHLYRKTRFPAVFYVTNMLYSKPLNVNNNRTVLLISQLLLLNVAIFKLPIATNPDQKRLASNLVTIP